MDDRSTLYYVSRLLTWGFSLYVLYTLSINHWPDTLGIEIVGFLLNFFWILGVQWGAFRLIHLCGDLREEQCIFLLQLALMGWTLYTFRFVYNTDIPYNADAFLLLPLRQYGILVIVLLVMMVRYNRGHK